MLDDNMTYHGGMTSLPGGGFDVFSGKGGHGG